MVEFIILIMCRQAQQRLKFRSISNKIVGILAGCDTYLAIIPGLKFRGLFIWLIGFFLSSRSALFFFFFAQLQAILISACRKLKQGRGLGRKSSKNIIGEEVKELTLPYPEGPKIMVMNSNLNIHQGYWSRWPTWQTSPHWSPDIEHALTMKVLLEQLGIWGF